MSHAFHGHTQTSGWAWTGVLVDEIHWVPIPPLEGLARASPVLDSLLMMGGPPLCTRVSCQLLSCVPLGGVIGNSDNGVC